VFVHWSIVFGWALIAFWSHADLATAVDRCLAYTSLIAAHEFGHALAAASCGLKVYAIDFTGLGGSCRVEAPRSVGSGFLMLAGGLIAQLILLGGMSAYIALFGWPTSTLGLAYAATYTVVNFVLIVLNLIPRRIRQGLSSDGGQLWQLLMHVLRGRPFPWLVPKTTSRVFPPDTRLLTRPGMTPRGFNVGVEILNDDKTPMDFVVNTLAKNLGLDQQQAIATMLNIHNCGGQLLPTRDLATAQQVAQAIADDCRSHNQALICRAVERSAGR
jgi:ATP-dependent Clp protease adapter protein ClpS